MPFPTFISNLKIGHLYTFNSPKVSSTIPHHFIFLGYTSGQSEFVFNCCTTKFSKRVAYADKAGLSYQTIVPIKPDTVNNLTNPDSCMDCNTPIFHTKSELEVIFNNPPHPRAINIYGTLSENHINQILIGTHLSDMVDEWIKEITPRNIDNIPAQFVI